MAYVTKRGESVVVITQCVLSYPHLFEPRAAAPGAEPKFSANLILPALDEADNAILAEVMNHAIAQKFPQGAPQNLSMPWRTVDEKTPEYTGRNCINAGTSAKNPPDVVLEDPSKRATPQDIYPGIGVNVYLGCFAYDTAGNRGVSFALNAIQVADRTLPNLGNKMAPENVFSAVSAPAAAVMPGAPSNNAAGAVVPPAPVDPMS